MSDEFALCRAAGIQVYEVHGFDRDVLYVENEGIGFVRDNLTPDDRQWAAAWLLDAALDELVEPV